MTDCEVPCFGTLQADKLAPVLKACEHGEILVSTCRVDSAALAPLRAEAHADVRLTFAAVSGTIDLEGAQLHDLVIVGSKLDELDLHDATFDRVRIAPSSDSVPTAYPKDAVAPVRVSIKSVEARSCHARTFALVGVEVGDVSLKHLRIDDSLDLTWTEADAVSLRFASAARFEAARLVTHGELDLLGAHFSDASLWSASLKSVNAETASIDRVLSLNNASVKGPLDAYMLSAGVVNLFGARVDSMTLDYAHAGLLDVDSAIGFERGAVTVTGLHVDSVSGSTAPLTDRITRQADDDGAFHSIEMALRNGGRYSEANSVAFRGSWFTAGIAGKLPGGCAAGVAAFFVACCVVAALCCKAKQDDPRRSWKVALCALDIVLPSFVDIGALSAWTDYDAADKEGVHVRIEGGWRTIAFVMRILGTMAFTYLLLYVTTLRG